MAVASNEKVCYYFLFYITSANPKVISIVFSISDLIWFAENQCFFLKDLIHFLFKSPKH